LQEENGDVFSVNKNILAKTEPFVYIVFCLVDLLGDEVFIVTRYILREHVGPFFFGLATIVFVFLLNLVFRDLGRLLGKGLPVGIILEFFGLNLAWIVALAIPMSVLVATLMAFGRLSSDNEIAALKAGGVHLYRLIAPVVIAAAFLTFGMERFNNSVLPDFNHQVRLLYSDISRKRPTLTLEPNVFFDEIPQYSMLVHEIKEKENLLKGIIINDQSDRNYSKTIIAQRGKVIFSKEQEKMVFSLFDGEIHEVDLKNFENYRRMKFQQQVLSISVSNMELRRSNSEHRGDREKSAKMMREDIQKNREAIRLREDRIREYVRQDFTETFPKVLWIEEMNGGERGQSLFKKQDDTDSYRRTGRMYQKIRGETNVIRGYRRAVRSLRVEIHKKYSIPLACIVFVLVGAPLGIVARQGSLAVGGGLSLVFFLIYWTFLIGGEQLADRGIVGPVVAMWAPNLLVGIGGIYLLIRTVREATFIPWERWSHWLHKVGRRGNS